MAYTIERLRELDPGLGLLAVKSEAEGFNFLRRLIDEWRSGENRFDNTGEALFGAYQDARLMGVCGLNGDPYVAVPGVGRVRRTYVSPEVRGTGVGRTLLENVIGYSGEHFDILQLRSQQASNGYYEAMGFRRVTDEEHVTHRMSPVRVRTD